MPRPVPPAQGRPWRPGLGSCRRCRWRRCGGAPVRSSLAVCGWRSGDGRSVRILPFCGNRGACRSGRPPVSEPARQRRQRSAGAVGLDGRIDRIYELRDPPDAVAIGPHGVVYYTIADEDNQVVWRWDPTTKTSARFAGRLSGAGAACGQPGVALATCPIDDGNPATSVSLLGVSGLAVDARGRLLIADTEHYLIRRVELDGTMSHIAGTGVYCFAIDPTSNCAQPGLAAADTPISPPSFIASSRNDGATWFTVGRALYRVATSGSLVHAFAPRPGVSSAPRASTRTVARSSGTGRTVTPAGSSWSVLQAQPHCSSDEPLPARCSPRRTRAATVASPAVPRSAIRSRASPSHETATSTSRIRAAKCASSRRPAARRHDSPSRFPDRRPFVAAPRSRSHSERRDRHESRQRSSTTAPPTRTGMPVPSRSARFAGLAASTASSSTRATTC